MRTSKIGGRDSGLANITLGQCFPSDSEINLPLPPHISGTIKDGSIARLEWHNYTSKVLGFYVYQVADDDIIVAEVPFTGTDLCFCEFPINGEHTYYVTAFAELEESLASNEVTITQEIAPTLSDADGVITWRIA